jgi:hypothetical protein
MAPGLDSGGAPAVKAAEETVMEFKRAVPRGVSEVA